MLDSIQIRLATAADGPRLAEFNCAMAWETERKRLDFATVLAGVQNLVAQEQAGFYLAACAGEQLVGCLLVTYEWSDWRNGNFWWIQSVYVIPEQRRHGVFRRLYGEVTKRARAAENVCGLRLYVERENHAAQRTYGRLGMQETPYRIFEFELPKQNGPGLPPSDGAAGTVGS